jgi:hypothetical protein
LFILPAPIPGVSMQDNVIQAQSQPFVKLMQDNMDLLTRFSTSPEVTAETTANASKVFQQATEFTMKLMQSGAFTHVIQGMLRNYTEFLAAFSQNGMAMVNTGQAA